MHQNKTPRPGVATLISFLVCTLFGATGLPAGALPAAEELISINGPSPGRVFDGVGGVSAGASTRLLYDYPEPQRRQILDYLFKPNYGAAMQVLKVEIGGDVNSTDGAEATHMRSPADLDCGRGYEWWLMQEAKARNPKIVLMGLEWGVPGWMQGGFWSEDNIAYILKWLDCAAAKGLKVEYIGGWNERKFNPDWYVRMSQAVKARYPHVRVIAADDCTDIWRVTYALSTNAAFGAAVDCVGVHFACGHRSQHEHCSSPAVALALNKPLWMSENSAQGHDLGASPWARAFNRMYIDAKVTAALCWPPVCSWYANLPLADTGIILAAWPWSGYYEVGQTVWVYAHTAQFVEPGWQYLDQSCGYLKSGGSYVTLKSHRSQDYSIILETVDAAAPQPVRFAVSDDLSPAPLQVWRTDLRSQEPRHQLVRTQRLQSRSRSFAVTLQPGCLYTLTTTTGQKKGTAVPPADAARQMPLPFREDFESRGAGRLARFFSDITGGFETAPCAGGRQGSCYRQCAGSLPIAWSPKAEMPPTTLAGDPRWWGDYELSCDVLLEESGFVELLARASNQRGADVAGYHLQLADSGAWKLYSQDVGSQDALLGSGSVPMSTGTWHKVTLRLVGSQLRAAIDGVTVAALRDEHHRTGQIGLRAAPGKHAQFDNVSVVPTGPAPQWVPHRSMRAVATSEHPGSVRGWNYTASNAIDAHPETAWSTEWAGGKPKLPQAITLDLGQARPISGLLYQPRLDSADGRITRYRVAVSADGNSFRPVAEGGWSPSSSTKVVGWPASKARFVRLEALEGVKGMASAAEIKIATRSNCADFCLPARDHPAAVAPSQRSSQPEPHE